jgi:GSH-dependent disulfide-bond oxidoreductase
MSFVTKPSLPSTYVVPKVWKPSNSEEAFKGMNRPTAGARDDRKLPIGTHDLQLYSLGTPNGQKVTILLEELGVEYDAFFINIMDLDQFGSDFVKLNPNSKIPVLQDRSVEPPLRVFESVSILCYLGEKYGKFVPKDLHAKTEMMNWVIWNVGTAPYIGNV